MLGELYAMMRSQPLTPTWLADSLDSQAQVRAVSEPLILYSKLHFGGQIKWITHTV